MTRVLPDWWAAARERRKQGASYSQLADEFDKSYDTIRHAVNIRFRARRLKKSRAAYKKQKRAAKAAKRARK